VSHAQGCFRSDGDWFCVAGCTHDRDEARAAARVASEALEAAACAVADAWASGRLEPFGADEQDIRAALNAIEALTRGSTLRKVKP
jgi:hypothetical protein